MYTLVALAVVSVACIFAQDAHLADDQSVSDVQQLVNVICDNYAHECVQALKMHMQVEDEAKSGDAEKRGHRGMIRFGKRKSAYFRFGRSAPDVPTESELESPEKRKSQYFRFG